jgi:5-methylcytosine-specific restriction endonuclease McrA
VIGIMKTDGRVLVLNQNYEPLNVTSWQRAVSLLFLGKAIPVQHDGKLLRSATTQLRLPTVVRLNYHVRRPLPEVKISRSSIMARDAHTCQYCGKKAKNLTLDHVVPKERGGGHTWENLVACCIECNNKKGNQTVEAAGLALARQPRRPRFIPYLSYATFTAALKHDEWRDYLEPFAPHLITD